MKQLPFESAELTVVSKVLKSFYSESDGKTGEKKLHFVIYKMGFIFSFFIGIFLLSCGLILLQIWWEQTMWEKLSWSEEKPFHWLFPALSFDFTLQNKKWNFQSQRGFCEKHMSEFQFTVPQSQSLRQGLGAKVFRPNWSPCLFQIYFPDTSFSY